MKMRCWLMFKFVLLAMVGFVPLCADVSFDNFTSNLLLKTTNAQFKMVNRANILGFSGESIVEDFGHNDPSNWAEAYANNGSIGITGATKIPSTDLVTSNSFYIGWLSANLIPGPGASVGSVDGRYFPRFQTTLHYFPAGTSGIQGFVYLGGGFTIDPLGTAVMDTVQTCSGPINLGDTGKMVLGNDVYFTHAVTLTTGGYIQGKKSQGGQANTLFLNGDLTLSNASGTPIIHITGDWNTVGASSGDLIIDGQGHTLNIQSRAQIFVDQNVTLTLRNMTLRTGASSINNSPIQLASFGSKLALDNVIFDLGADFHFPQGQIFIHDDVAVTGTSAFVYQSPVPSYITSGATWSFETGTTFSVAPATYTDQPFTAGTATSNRFIVPVDQSAALVLDNCSLQTTYTGLRLTTGMVLFKDKVAIDTLAGVDLNNTTPVVLVGGAATGTQPYGVSWSPDGRFLVVANFNSSTLQVYSFNGSSAPTSLGTTATSSSPRSIAWSSDGRFLTVAHNDYTVRVYRFNGSSALTTVGSAGTGVNPYSASWSPDGRFLAVANYGASTMQVYSFNGSSAPTSLGTAATGSSPRSVSWSPDGRFLAVANYGETTNGLQVYRFNGSSAPTFLGTAGTGANSASVSWSPDGRFLAVASSGASTMQVYSFNGSSAPTSLGTAGTGSTPFSVSWSPDGRFLAVANQGSSTVQVYSFNGSSAPTSLGTAATGASPNSVSWSSDGRFLAVANFSGTTVQVFRCNYYYTGQPAQGFSNGLLFGNSALGSAYDASVQVLGGAAVPIKGMVSDDSA